MQGPIKTSMGCIQKHTKKQTPLQRLRNTIINLQLRTSQFNKFRYSYSSDKLKNVNLSQSTQLRESSIKRQKKTTYKSLKNYVDILENRVNSAKQELKIYDPNMKKKRKTIYNHQIIESKDMVNKDINNSIIKKQIREKKADNFESKRSKYKILTPKKQLKKNHFYYYVRQVVRAKDQKNSLALYHVNTSIRMMKACEAYQIPTIDQLYDKKLYLNKNEKYRNKKTLILDLDETLIHCLQMQQVQADLKIRLKIEGSVINIAVNIRPYALTFLKKMAQLYQIIVFTASHKIYANSILDQLDPQKQIFQHRLYREHCFHLGNDMYVKDLRILNRDLANVILVDNAAYSYFFQLQNGIPILPFYQGIDKELVILEKYLIALSQQQDVRLKNIKTFKLHHYTKFLKGEQLIEHLYINNFD